MDHSWRPASRAEAVLGRLDPGRFTPEIGKFNVEFNLEPFAFGGDCLSRLHEALDVHLMEVRRAAAEEGLEVLMTGILPTLRKSDLGLHNMMPYSRYAALNEALKRLRGGTFDLRLTGTGRAHRQARLRDDGGLQHQLPGALPGGAGGTSRASTTSPRW